MPSTSTVPVPSTATTTRGAALAAIFDELAAIPSGDVLTPRVDIPAAVLTVIGAAPKIEKQRDAITLKFGAEAARSIDRLVPLARAMNLAQGEYVASIDAGLEEIARELGEHRTRLAIDAEVLVRRKALPAKKLSGLVGGQAYQGRINDVTTLVSLFRNNWSRIAPHTKVSEADLDRAERAMERFTDLYAEREQASTQTLDAADVRARAFTLFFNAYDHVRRMLTLLRWHEGDADEIAPSIYAGRTRSRDADNHETNDATPAPVPSPVATPAPINPIPPGMPGADPFRS